MIQADLVDFGCEAVDEFAFGELETLFEDLHDVHTSVMAGVDEFSMNVRKPGILDSEGHLLVN